MVGIPSMVGTSYRSWISVKHLDMYLQKKKIFLI